MEEKKADNNNDKAVWENKIVSPLKKPLEVEERGMLEGGCD